MSSDKYVREVIEKYKSSYKIDNLIKSLMLENKDTYINCIDNDTFIETNRESTRIEEIILLKIWSNINELNLPLSYLEYAIHESLIDRPNNKPAENFIIVLKRLSEGLLENDFELKTMDYNEKGNIAKQAAITVEQRYWIDIVW